MTIGVSIALIVVGAILRYAVTYRALHVNLQMVGLILMIAGFAGFILALIFAISHRDRRTGADVYEERHYREPRP